MRRFASILAIALATAVGLLAAAPPYASADEGYRQTAATVYRLDPANGRLRVTVTLKVTNRTPDSQEPYSCIEYTEGWFPIPYPSTCYNVTRYYLTTTSALVENEATAVKAVSGGKRLAVANGDARRGLPGRHHDVPEALLRRVTHRQADVHGEGRQAAEPHRDPHDACLCQLLRHRERH